MKHKPCNLYQEYLNSTWNLIYLIQETVLKFYPLCNIENLILDFINFLNFLFSIYFFLLFFLIHSHFLPILIFFFHFSLSFFTSTCFFSLLYLFFYFFPSTDSSTRLLLHHSLFFFFSSVYLLPQRSLFPLLVRLRPRSFDTSSTPPTCSSHRPPLPSTSPPLGFCLLIWVI
jgi:hypothetical protein